MKKRNVVKIAPSLLSANYSDLTEEIKRVEKAGANLIHWDIMDGCYVPVKNFSAEIVKKNRTATKLLFDVHLMVCKPEKKIQAFIEAGADYISFHAETCNNAKELIERIKKAKVKVGLAVNANVEVETVFPFLEKIDFVLIMSVQAGKAGQAFMQKSLEKIKKLRKELKKRKLKLEIEIDGGINEKTAALCRKEGADILVSGSTIFKSNNMKEIIEKLRNC